MRSHVSQYFRYRDARDSSTDPSPASSAHPEPETGPESMGQPQGKILAESFSQNDTFGLFPNFPYDIRLIIWEECCQSAPRVIDVEGCLSDTNGNKQWRTRTPQPAIFRVCWESRQISEKKFKFCHDVNMRLWLNPSVDTLHFGPTESDWNFSEFLVATKWEDLKELKRLAVNEMYLAAWQDWATAGILCQIKPSPPSLVLVGLEKLMIGLQVASLDYDHNKHHRPDGWEGWQYGGGPLTVDERRMYASELPKLDFPDDSLKSHLFHLTERPEYPEDLDAMVPTSAIKLFSFYHPLELETRGLKRGAIARLGPWYRRIHTRLRRTDVRVERMFAMHRRENPEITSSWIPPDVTCFVRPAESFRNWEDSLNPLCEGNW